jgi:nucleoside-diphosphate-sugar epimerase
MSLDNLRGALEGLDTIVHVARRCCCRPNPKIGCSGSTRSDRELEAARSRIRKIVTMSSECASGIINVHRQPPPCPDYLPIDEAHELRPPETYGLSKQLNELTARSFARGGGMQIVALRPTLVLNPEMGDYVEKARSIDDPDLWSYVELQDVVQAARLALDYDGPPFDAFYLSARDNFAPEETLTFMERRFGRRFEIRDRGSIATTRTRRSGI